LTQSQQCGGTKAIAGQEILAKTGQTKAKMVYPRMTTSLGTDES
jgi:hypothetical protein